MNVQQSEDTSEAIAVSILIPVYGVEDYIERCARSIFEQTYPNIEYIFCDDCSPDQSISVLRRVMKDYPLRAKHTRILRHKKNRGLAAARNTLVEACRTDWLMHVDSDDWVEHDAVSLLVKKQSKTKADIVWGDLIKRSHQKEEYVTNPDATYKKDIICKLLDCTVFHHICGKLIRKSIYDDFNIKAVDGIDMGEDWYVVIPLYYHATEYAKVNHCIVHYERRRSQALTAKRERLDVNYLQSDYPAVDIIWSFLENKETSWKETFYKTQRTKLLKDLSFAAYYGKKTFHHQLTQRINEVCIPHPLKMPWTYQVKRHYILYRVFMKWLYRNEKAA